MKRLLSLLLAAGLTSTLVLPASALELEDAKRLLRTYYIDTLPENFEELDSLDAILDAIGDPYTSYLTKEEYQRFNENVNGASLVGIGVSIQTVYQDGYQILSVLPDSPALDAGLQAGDSIVAVDGIELTAEIDPTTLIRGEEGTEVTLTIQKADTGEQYNITLPRKPVVVPIVTYEMVDDALVITCDSFGNSTASTVGKALSEFEDSAALCIFDLRSNPGGTSTAAAGSAGYFVGSQIMSYFRDSDGEYNYVYTAPDQPDLTEKPVIVLTSAYSASGSELFSAAIRDYRGGIALGQRTFGKGVAQYVFDEDNYPHLFDGDCLKITVYRFYSPDGATNDTMGVLPTLMISPEHTAAAALLLSSAQPNLPKGFWKLELAGHTFYLNEKDCLLEENRPAFTELLEALPASAKLWKGGMGGWLDTTPAALAAEMALDYTPRTFSDIADSAYQTELNGLACYQLVGGYEDGTFRPQQSITRAEFCALINRVLDLPAVENGVPFTDVKENDWFHAPVSAMTAKGFLAGYGDGTFRPENPITYQEIVAVMNNIYAWACMDGYDLAQTELGGKAAQTYGAYSPWAQVAARNLDVADALLWEADPTASATRDMAAATLYRLLDGCGMLWY